MKNRKLVLLLFLFSVSARAEGPIFSFQDNWANWQSRLDRAYEGIKSHKMPGRCAGILVPGNPRTDILPLSAIGYQTLTQDTPASVVILLQAPEGSNINGLVVPAIDQIETSLGRFVVDDSLRLIFQNGPFPVTVDPSLFTLDIPAPLQTQLAHLTYALKRRAHSLKILPIYVKFNQPDSQVKDYAPFLAESLKDAGLENDVGFIVVADVSVNSSREKLIRRDNVLLAAIRNQDVDTMLQPDPGGVTHPDLDTLALGVLTLRLLSSDHAEILAYAHSAQLVLSKDKSVSTSFVTAGFASAPPIRVNQPHVDREKMVDTFDELTRSDILAVTRQACISILDSTAAKPPSLTNKQGGKKWPVYVSLYGPGGEVAGQAGTHVALGPLEESLRKYSLDAVEEAQPTLTKSNFQNYVVDVSIPYGFIKISEPEEYIPLLNGVIVQHKLKTLAFHPDAWRTFPDPHQLLSSICVELGLKPWAYATGEARLESFRILSFNEKEPFQDLAADERKKKKKKSGADQGLDDLGIDDGGGGGGGGSPFSF